TRARPPGNSSTGQAERRKPETALKQKNLLPAVQAGCVLSILAFKGFTTITNSGAEITDPHRNVGRAIVWSIAICIVVYLLVAFAVGSSLSLDRIVRRRTTRWPKLPDPPLVRPAST
ncbi:amino acid permease, partial [Aurantimonas sp. A2-1-M11]|uniref:amino acid permease n=1 Tax=Aurantimonas sp. A2-1-M11 TaxID=3113712 RepID=UPI002F920D09